MRHLAVKSRSIESEYSNSQERREDWAGILNPIKYASHESISKGQSCFQGKKRGRTSDGDYLPRECFAREGTASKSWRIDQHVVQTTERSSNDYGTLGYHSIGNKPLIKSDSSPSTSDSSVNGSGASDDMFVKTDEPIDPATFLDPNQTEYDQGSDESIENSDESQYVFGQASSSETTTDDTDTVASSQAWWKGIPQDQKYSPESADLQRQLVDEKLTDDEGYDPETLEYTYEQKPRFLHAVKQEEPNMYFAQNKAEVFEQKPFAWDLEPQPIRQELNPRVYCNKREKNSPDPPKVKSIRVKKFNEMSRVEESRSQVFDKTVNNRIVRKNNNAREPLRTLDREFYHDGRRMTRSFSKSIENVCPNINREDHIGKFVWGYCNGWWPAIIVAAEDGGLEPKPDKLCVYWIGEDLISLLNEKTQVESFSSNLEIRLIRFLRDNEGARDRRKACFVTLKLFSKYLGIPLIKPHVTWAEKHLMGKSHLNDVKFYPFPKNMQQRLHQLKVKNIRTAEEHVRSLHNQAEPRDGSDKGLRENGSRRKFPKDLVRKATNELVLNTQDQHILPLMDQKPGVIVWGKISGHSWWPAMIVHNHDCGTKEPNFGCQWIIWYGDYQLSQVNYLNVMKFDEGIQKMLGYITQCRREKYINAVLNACKDHCARLGYDTSSWTMSEVLAWVSSLNTNGKISAVSKPTDGRLESRYSSHIAKKLNEMKANQDIAVERKSRIQSCDALKVRFAEIFSTLEVLCVVCLKIHPRDGVEDHPFFECVICKNCVEEYKATIFAYGDDGKSFYCALCAGSDTVVMCDSYDCPRVYCTACLKYLICPTEYNEILIKDPWLCFLCEDPEGLNKSQIFKPRSDWKTKVGQLFHTNFAEETNWDAVWNNDRPSRKMRVLSLFDGISTGLLVLEKLDIDVEDYFASEIDADAEIVSSAYFGARIHRLGDVRTITEDVIDAIAPIDLLIGGSPCNDLSLVNPNRLGLHDPNGTGVLFFDYCRIKELVTKANEGHHLFWLFENVASMPSEYRLAINEALQCEPILIDAADFSPQHRPRLFWNNLPIGINFPPPEPSQYLQSVLTPNCNRHALVKKIRTVTTKVNSLKQGVSLLKPVLMNEKADSLWITELESIFGFPKHYTDVRNLSATKRQKLIGQSWSVQSITAILRPLRYFFITKSVQEHN